MPKPLLRFTCGRVSDTGYDVLKESIHIAKETLSKFNFDFMVCCNNQTPERLQWLTELCGIAGIELMEQKWPDLPIAHVAVPQRDSEVVNAIWKVCPARVRLDAHEIIVDNDLIICKPMAEIERFLKSDQLLMLQDPLRWFGHYDHKIEPHWAVNTGIIGLPPGYDFGDEINQHWVGNGSHVNHSLGDEQGLLALTMIQSSLGKIIISKDTVIELHPNGIWHNWDDADKNIRYRFTGREGGFHFVEVNRKPKHEPWEQFKTNLIYKKLLL